jgi:hypothetical protein
MKRGVSLLFLLISVYEALLRFAATQKNILVRYTPMLFLQTICKIGQSANMFKQICVIM